MIDLSIEDSSATNDLAFYMLKEAYTAAVQAFMRHDRDAARELVDGVEGVLTAAVQAMHSAETEGPRSREIALALGSKLVSVFDQAHQEPPSASLRKATDELVVGRQAFAFFANLKVA